MRAGLRLLAFFVFLSAAARGAGPELRPGLALTFHAGERQDGREARLVALQVPAGQPVSPLIPAGPFTAVWEGVLLSPLKAACTFAVEVRGEMTLSINGEKMLTASGHAESKMVALRKGANELKVEYRSPAEGEATLRLLWASSEFPYEPVPPASLAHAELPAPVQTGERLRQGRLLFAEHRCAACHDAAGALPAPGTGMPELAQDAPVFADFGARFNESWMAYWISDPHAMRPHSLMPRLLPVAPQGQAHPQAADIAAYLASLGEKRTGKIDEANVPLGGALFANLGCIACHSLPDASAREDEFGRVPLSHVKAKWQEPALREYLRDPQKFYRWTRMPNFRLSESEATQLAAFLLNGTQQEFAGVPKGDAARGGALVASLGCLNCHAGVPPTKAPKLAETLRRGWKTGCLADTETERGRAPEFAFTATERAALREVAAVGLDVFKNDVPLEFAQRQIAQLRCTACHASDGEPSTWARLDNETAPLLAEAPLPEGEGLPIGGPTAPIFTWLGEKLRPEWAARFIAGEVAYKPRPWLVTRMPGFGVRAEGLARGMALGHGFAATGGENKPETNWVKEGATLLGENGGFNCTTCHGVGDRPATAVFEAPGTNLAYAHERLRAGYFHRWVYYPTRLDPETKMPRFSDDEGKTPLTEVLEGKARDQFEAIWQYLGTVPKPAH